MASSTEIWPRRYQSACRQAQPKRLSFQLRLRRPFWSIPRGDRLRNRLFHLRNSRRLSGKPSDRSLVSIRRCLQTDAGTSDRSCRLRTPIDVQTVTKGLRNQKNPARNRPPERRKNFRLVDDTVTSAPSIGTSFIPVRSVSMERSAFCRLSGSPSDRHRFADRFHRRCQSRVRAGKFLEREPRHLSHDVVDCRLKAGRRHPGNIIVEFVQSITDSEFCGDLAIGNPVAFEASAEDRDTRGFVSMTTKRPSSGFTANCTLIHRHRPRSLEGSRSRRCA